MPFSPEQYFRWRKYYPYSGGLVADLLLHRILPVLLATGRPEFPKRVVSVASRPVHADRKTPGMPERDVPEHVEVLAEFPSGFTVIAVASTGSDKSPGSVIYGHHATLSISDMGDRLELLPERPFFDGVDPVSVAGLSPTGDPLDAHEKNWFDCIRANQQPKGGIELAIRGQTVISLAEISERLNVTCLFDDQTREIRTGDGRKIEPLTYGTVPLS